MFKISDSTFKQAAFELGPLLRKTLFTVAAKTIAASFFGWGTSNIFESITSYRMKKVKKGGPLDEALKILSFSGPLFELEKLFTRSFRAPELLLRYNIAGFPGLVWSLKANRDIVTNQRIITANFLKEPHRVIGQLGWYMFRTYFPWMPDVIGMSTQDKTLAENLITIFRLGYFYDIKSPRRMLEDFRKATGEARTVKEYKEASKRLYYGLRATEKTLMGEEYKSFFDELEKSTEKTLQRKIRR